VNGGWDAPCNQIIVYRQGEKPRSVTRVGAEPFRNGNLVSLRSTGGGGWGDPLERNPRLVLEDYKNELITQKTAKEVYGVIIDPGRMGIDQKGTKELRNKIKLRNRLNRNKLRMQR